MTLTELLIASILMSVILVSALAADLAIRTWQKQLEDRVLVGMDIAVAMEQIKADGMATAGVGVGIGTAPSQRGVYYSSSRYIAFRQDPDITLEGDEYYVVYDAPGLFLRRDGVDFFRITEPDFLNVLPSMIGDGVEVFEITLKTRPDPDSPEDPVKNPEQILKTSFFPAGVSQ